MNLWEICPPTVTNREIFMRHRHGAEAHANPDDVLPIKPVDRMTTMVKPGGI